MTVSELYKKADEASPGPRGLALIVAAAAVIGTVATVVHWLLG